MTSANNSPDYGVEDPRDYGAREEEERQMMRHVAPSYCYTEDEYRDLLSGHVTEHELRTRHARQAALRAHLTDSVNTLDPEGAS